MAKRTVPWDMTNKQFQFSLLNIISGSHLIQFSTLTATLRANHIDATDKEIIDQLGRFLNAGYVELSLVSCPPKDGESERLTEFAIGITDTGIEKMTVLSREL